jgi:hypothetical protein
VHIEPVAMRACRYFKPCTIFEWSVRQPLSIEAGRPASNAVLIGYGQQSYIVATEDPRWDLWLSLVRFVRTMRLAHISGSIGFFA